MKKLATVDKSSRRCSAIVCCISREGRCVSLKMACRVRFWMSVNTRRGLFEDGPPSLSDVDFLEVIITRLECRHENKPVSSDVLSWCWWGHSRCSINLLCLHIKNRESSGKWLCDPVKHPSECLTPRFQLVPRLRIAEKVRQCSLTATQYSLGEDGLWDRVILKLESDPFAQILSIDIDVLSNLSIQWIIRVLCRIYATSSRWPVDSRRCCADLDVVGKGLRDGARRGRSSLV